MNEKHLVVLCGGHAAQPPIGEYGESCLLWDPHLCSTCITVANTCGLSDSILYSLRFPPYVWSFFSFFFKCVFHVWNRPNSPSHAPGISGYFFFFVLSLCWLVGQLRSFQRETESILWNIYTVCWHYSPWEFITLWEKQRFLLSYNVYPWLKCTSMSANIQYLFCMSWQCYTQMPK